MKIVLIAGNRLLPILLAKAIAHDNNNHELVGICFKGETSRKILPYLDRVYWINPGEFSRLRSIVKSETADKCLMAGQISPWRIFFPYAWDTELKSLIETIDNFCPHTIFTAIINKLEQDGVEFLDSTLFLKTMLAKRGLMNHCPADKDTIKDVDFGVKMALRYVDLDIGQSLCVRNCAVVAAEALEGTDNTIRRALSVAGKGIVMVKFAKHNQDMRFDVPVVGIKTLQLLRKIGARALVLEENKVLILEKDRFLALADKYKISIIGVVRI